MEKFFRLILTLSAIVICTNSQAQKDKDVKEKDVPVPIKDYLKKNYPEASKLKYYMEIEGDTTFYEATFTLKNDQYNLLLFADGRLYETEIVIKYEELPSNVKEKISQDLKTRYSKHVVRKVEQVNPHGELKYEIEVRAKKGGHHGYFELYYDKNGNFLEEEEETIKSIPNNSGF